MKVEGGGGGYEKKKLVRVRSHGAIKKEVEQQTVVIHQRGARNQWGCDINGLYGINGLFGISLFLLSS